MKTIKALIKPVIKKLLPNAIAKKNILRGSIKVKEIHNLLLMNILRRNEAFQRLAVAGVDFSSELIGSILRGTTPTTIYLWMQDGIYWVVDGLQRCTAIKKFMIDNTIMTPYNKGEGINYEFDDGEKLTIKECYYSGENSLTSNPSWEDGIKEDFLNYEFNVVIYNEKWNIDAIAEEFIRLNNGTDLNDMEKINPIMGIGADRVREFARIDLNEKENKKIHSLFSHISSTSTRMQNDLLTAKFAQYEYMNLHKELGIYSYTMSLNGVRQLYLSRRWRNDTNYVDEIMNNVSKRMTMIEKIIKASKVTTFSNSHSKLLTLYQITYWLDEWFAKETPYTYNERDINYEKFSRILYDVIFDLMDVEKHEKTKRENTRFGELLSLYTPSEITEKRKRLFDALLKHTSTKDALHLSDKLGILLLDKREKFSAKHKDKKRLEQKHICPISNKKLENSKESHGDHIIPRSWGVLKGGVTEYKNLQILHESVNIYKSNKDISNNELKRLWKEKNKKVA